MPDSLIAEKLKSLLTDTYGTPVNRWLAGDVIEGVRHETSSENGIGLERAQKAYREIKRWNDEGRYGTEGIDGLIENLDESQTTLVKEHILTDRDGRQYFVVTDIAVTKLVGMLRFLTETEAAGSSTPFTLPHMLLTLERRPGGDNRSSEGYTVKALFADGRIIESEIKLSFRDDTAHALAAGRPMDRWYGAYCLDLEIDGKRFEGTGRDYFSALVELRRALEADDVKLLVFGARRDVWASFMQRDMGEGRRAYLLSADVPGRKPMFSIFTDAPAETIGTVAEQEAYYEEWVGKWRVNSE